MDQIQVTIVVSVYNEEEVINLFWNELSKAIHQADLPAKFEVIFVNDGSTDNTASMLDELSAGNENVKVIHFSRNFGHECTMLAGITHAGGDAVICMDSDLQHPPSCLKDMIRAFSEGAGVVTMKRVSSENKAFFAKFTSRMFYRLINSLSDYKFEPDASDFFLVSARVAEVITRQYPERTRFLRGLIQSVGFRQVSLEYSSPERPAGSSKYSLSRLFFLSFSAIASFSNIPLRLGLGIGLIFGLISFLIGAYSIARHFLGSPMSGYTTIVVLLSFGFALMFVVMGIIGQYIGYLFSEVKKRPLFIIERVSGIKDHARVTDQDTMKQK
jgi:polyisoprenyl-phosphate glycosyltransferase